MLLSDRGCCRISCSKKSMHVTLAPQDPLKTETNQTKKLWHIRKSNDNLCTCSYLGEKFVVKLQMLMLLTSRHRTMVTIPDPTRRRKLQGLTGKQSNNNLRHAARTKCGARTPRYVSSRSVSCGDARNWD